MPSPRTRAMCTGLILSSAKKQTLFQKVEILDTFSYGRCLVLDGKMQSSEVDEFVYHEALVHPAMLTHPNPKRVFIVGGGRGGDVAGGAALSLRYVCADG